MLLLGFDVRRRGRGEGRGAVLERAAGLVAARQGHILATSFHPELTSDSRWHAMFLDMVRERKKE